MAQRDLEEYAKAYEACEYEHFHASCRQKILSNALSKYKPKSWMEVGCGLKTLYSCYDKADITYVIEPSEKFISHAKEQFPPSKSLVYINKFLEDLTPEEVNLSCDCIVISGLLHEVESPAKLLQSARKFGNRDTKYIITVPNANSLHRHSGVSLGATNSLHDVSQQHLDFQQHHVFCLFYKLY